MGIRINMENKIDDLERRVFMLEGAVEDLLEIYKENNNDKKEKLQGKKSTKKKDVSKQAKAKKESK
tara:strand:+ start:37 stop:234 length:198 start_codon:yes stop_codon:yes gene_type:complete